MSQHYQHLFCHIKEGIHAKLHIVALFDQTCINLRYLVIKNDWSQIIEITKLKSNIKMRLWCVGYADYFLKISSCAANNLTKVRWSYSKTIVKKLSIKILHLYLVLCWVIQRAMSIILCQLQLKFIHTSRVEHCLPTIVWHDGNCV